MPSGVGHSLSSLTVWDSTSMTLEIMLVIVLIFSADRTALYASELLQNVGAYQHGPLAAARS